MTETQQSILIVDDDTEICALLSIFLGRKGFRADSAHTSKDAEVLLARQSYDLIILDIMMPGEDGLQFCERLRRSDQTPILMLTALGEEVDRIQGLELGADDYLAKPFNPDELLARVKAIIRRTSPQKQSNTTYSFGAWRLNILRRELRRDDGTLVPLSSGEYALLEALARGGGQSVDRGTLMAQTRGREADPLDRTMDIQLSRLRKKLGDDAKEQRLIKTIRNSGYLLVLNEGDAA